jgi:RNA polymerase sigma-70 factor (ECF subfamily)
VGIGRVEDRSNIALLFAAFFWFNRSVLAKDNGASLSTIGLVGVGENGAVAFATTHWSIVVEAHSESPTAKEALDKLCRIYWRPVYSFVRRQGADAEEAKDLTQGFFALLLERRDLDAVRKEKGRLRSYLLTSLKHFLANQRRRARTAKRGKGECLIPLETLSLAERDEIEPTDPRSADLLYERRWAATLMDHVLDRLKREYCEAGNSALFDLLKQLLPNEAGAPSTAEAAAQLSMTENALRQALFRFRHRYQTLVREEIAFTVAQPSDIEDELRHFISVLRS